MTLRIPLDNKYNYTHAQANYESRSIAEAAKKAGVWASFGTKEYFGTGNLYDNIDETTTKLAEWNGLSSINVTLHRTFAYTTCTVGGVEMAEAYTVCLPFDVTLAGSPFASDKAEVLELVDVVYDGACINFNLRDVTTTMEAGKPYLIFPKVDIVNPTFENVNVTVTTGSEVTGTNGKFVGVLNPTDIYTGKADPTKVLFLGEANTLYYPNAAGTMNGFRAYFEITDVPAGVPARLNLPARETGIERVIDLPAQQAAKSIENGQLVITLPDGTRYNSMGQIIR
jgi:hypothetical protein